MPKKISISENQGRLPFGAARRLGAFVFERRLIMVLGLLIAGVAVVYAYCIVASVSHAALREGLARQNAALSGDVAALEQQYLTQGGAITEAYARSLGFVSPSSQVFIQRGGSLSFRDAR
jgi:hypothetical protein